MTAVYPLAVDAFLFGHIAVDTDTIKAQLVEGYTYSATHSTLADVGAGTRLDSAVTLTTLTASGGSVTCDEVTFPTVTTGHTVDGVVIYQDLGGESSRLIAYINARADKVPMSIDTDGSDLVFTWTKLFSL